MSTDILHAEIQRLKKQNADLQGRLLRAAERGARSERAAILREIFTRGALAKLGGMSPANPPDVAGPCRAQEAALRDLHEWVCRRGEGSAADPGRPCTPEEVAALAAEEPEG